MSVTLRQESLYIKDGNGDTYKDPTILISNIGQTEASVLANIETKKTDSIASLESKRTESLNNIETKRTNAIDDIETKRAASIASIPSDYTELSNDVSELESALKQSDNELFRVSGYLNQNYVKGRQRYVSNGEETFANNPIWISPAQGEYIELKSGDKIVVHQSNRYHFRVCYSTDNKVTWVMTSEQTSRFTMPSDAIVWIPIITKINATDEDVEIILNEHVIEIIRNGVNLVGKAISTVNGIMDVLNINPNSGFQIDAIKNGTTFVYVNTTATANGGTEKLFEIPCVKGDVFRLTFDFQAMISPENFNDYDLVVREIDQSEASPLRNVVLKLSELQTAADFTVGNANTKKIIANVNLKRSGTTVSSGYNEEISYAITVIKVLEQNDVYTEAGEAWEV